MAVPVWNIKVIYVFRGNAVIRVTVEWSGFGYEVKEEIAEIQNMDIGLDYQYPDPFMTLTFSALHQATEAPITGIMEVEEENRYILEQYLNNLPWIQSVLLDGIGVVKVQLTRFQDRYELQIKSLDDKEDEPTRLVLHPLM